MNYHIVLFISGKLILSLDKDSYEQLGLEGKPSLYSHKKIMRYGKSFNPIITNYYTNTIFLLTMSVYLQL